MTTSVYHHSFFQLRLTHYLIHYDVADCLVVEYVFDEASRSELAWLRTIAMVKVRDSSEKV